MRTFKSENIYYKQHDDFLEIIDVDSALCKKEIVITNEINGIPITHIGPKAFFNVPILESIYLPNNIQAIGHQAFENSTNLKDVTIQSGGTKFLNIDYCAFRDCKNLLKFTTDKFLRLNDGVFENCVNLTVFDAYISGKIPPYTFYDCQQMRCIYLNNEVTEICSFAFTNCHNLTSFFIDGAFKYDDEFETLLKNGKICCRMNSKFVELAYEGYDVQILGV